MKKFLITSSDDIKKNLCTTKDHSITVYVHGTFPARKLLEHSFCRYLSYCPQGLSLAKDLPDSYHFHKMASSIVAFNPDEYTLDQFYLFGWTSEKVKQKVRQKAGADLVEQLKILVVQYYEKYGVVPKLRLIGFSHGGNVILYTAEQLPIKVNEQIVDVEVWLFGTPVQQKNKNLVNSMYFSKVYSFYSKKDWLQRMDPQGLQQRPFNIKNLWSDRVFETTDRCIQIEFMVNGKSISHTYYRSILQYFPLIKNLTLDVSQGLHSGHISVNFVKD